MIIRLMQPLSLLAFWVLATLKYVSPKQLLPKGLIMRVNKQSEFG